MAGGETLLARRYRLEVDTGTVPETPVWSVVYGLQAFNPTQEATDADDSDFEDLGYKSSARVAQQFTGTATILFKKSADGTAVNPVHLALKQASEAMGEAAKVRIRYYDRDGLEQAYIWTVLVTWELDGEGTEDLGTASLTMTGCGAPTREANPAAA
jgi:hypothetical protein